MGRYTLDRLNIGPRLIVGFVFIVLSMLAADAVVLWQFHVVRTQAERLNEMDQTLVAVFRVHSSLSAFSDRLEALAQSGDADRLVAEAGPLRTAVLEHIRRASIALSVPPFVQQDPTILPTLHVIQSALSSQLDGITTLAAAADWRAVHLRASNQVRPLTSLASTLVESVAQQAGEQQAQVVRNVRRVEDLVFVMVPLTAAVTLLIAATLGLAITRSITQPLARLVEGSKALARGEFQHEVSVSGTDELAHVGHIFNETARRLREVYATLQGSENRLRRVIDTIPAHAWSTPADGSVDFINKRFLEFAGRSRDELVGWGWKSLLHPDDVTGFAERWRAALATGEPMESQARVRRADGEYRWLLIRNVPLRDESGHIINWYGTAIDIEEHHRAEEALRQVQTDLAHVSRVTMLGQMAASIAHEVDQPLSGVVINANACLRFLANDTLDLAEVHDGLQAIARDGRRASEVIARIRALARRAATEREPVDINQMIREVLILADGEARRTHARLLTELAADLPEVLGDRVQLQQVVLNLLRNGLDAMTSVVDRPRELVIRTQKDATASVQVAVQDSGSGLDPQHADRVFEPFYTTKRSGIGMGLSISRSIVEQHGGKLWAVPNEGPGTTFHFTV
jgi:PAS domain S-box-containing protein